MREAKVASEPEALIGFMALLDLPLARIGLGEAGPLSHWLQAALVEPGFAAVLLETRHGWRAVRRAPGDCARSS